MQRNIEALRQRGAEVVAVAQGSGDEAARFCRMLKTDYLCLGDPEKQLYAAFSLPRDSWWNITAQPFLDDPGLAFDRIRHASLKGSVMRHSDPRQLGGVAIVDTEGTLRYLHRSRRTDDLPTTAEILAQLDALGAAQ